MARRQSGTRSSAASSRSRRPRAVKPTDAASRRAALLEGQTEIFDLIARGGGLSDVLHVIVRSAEEQAAPALCSITVLARDGTRPIQIVASRLSARPQSDAVERLGKSGGKTGSYDLDGP